MSRTATHVQPLSSSTKHAPVSTYLNYTKPIAISKEKVIKAQGDEFVKFFYQEAGNMALDRTPVTILDIRGQEDQFTLSKQGFQLCSSPMIHSQVNFKSNESIKALYIPAIEKLVKEVTGAEHVMAWDHHVRCAEYNTAYEAALDRIAKKESENSDAAPTALGSDENIDTNGPIRRVHIDDTLPSSRKLFKHYASLDIFSKYKSHHMAIINAWRPLKTIKRDPLAVLDASTLPPEDRLEQPVRYLGAPDDFATYFIKKPSTGGDVIGNTNRMHRWYFVRDMQPSEVLLLKITDSRDEDFVGTAHSSFVDPNISPEVEARESIELRLFAFFN